MALIGDDEALKELTADAAFTGLDMPADEWRRLGSAMKVVNDIAVAHAAIVALANRCLIATTCPELYADLEDAPLLVIES